MMEFGLTLEAVEPTESMKAWTCDEVRLAFFGELPAPLGFSIISHLNKPTLF